MAGLDRIMVAAISGSLDWSLRGSCSHERFDPARAQAYVREYSALQIDRVARAVSQGARLVVGPEYFCGAEMCLRDEESLRLLAERTDGETTRRLCELAQRHGALIGWSCNVDHGPSGVHQTGLLATPDGRLAAVQPKHPRCIPAPDGWPFDTSPRVYRTEGLTVGITICSDCTYDPLLPLRMAGMGMDVLVLPGCGFVGSLWRHFVIVRARDTQCPVVYADDGHAAILDSAGKVLAESASPGDVVMAEVPLLPRKCSPDA